jgi:methylmalonyl-CoA mutase
LSSKGSPTVLPKEVIRATEEEKEYQISMLSNLQSVQQEAASEGIAKVQEAAVQNFNIFAELMETCKVTSLGQVTNALFEVGGQYRRNM